MKNKYTAWLVAGTIVGASALTAFAHGGATGIVKERMDAMTVMGDAVKTISDMFRSGTYDAEVVKKGADAIVRHSGDNLTGLFPEGSGGEPSKAKLAAWTNWTKFSNLADQLNAYAIALKVSADAPQGQQAPSGGMMSGGMMGASAMGSDAAMPTAEMLAQMPTDSLFDMVARTCASCHTKYRTKD